MSSKRGGPQLTANEIAAITARLEAGEYLDDYYRSRLFPQSKEVGVAYSGKTPAGVVLAETMAVPFQTLKRFGSPSAGDWTNLVIQGDNLQVLKTLLEMKGRGELKNADGSDGFKLCYVDPPFATRREFRTSKGQLAYSDKVEGAEFVEFLRKRLVFIHELLAEGGTLYLHLDTKKVHALKLVLDELFGEANFRNEIIWKRADAHSDARGQGGTDFGRIHDIILRYTKGSASVFQPQFLPLPEATQEKWYRHVEEDTGRRYNKADITGPGGAAKGNPRYEIFGVTRYWRYGKERMEELIAEGIVCQDNPGTVPYRKRYLDESPGVPLQDIWTDITMLRGYAGSVERTGYPTQKPVELLQRIIEASSVPGDLVLDTFVGSGTTAVVAEELGRRWVVVDCGKLAAYTTQKRLLSMTNGKGKRAKPVEPEPFELCAAGQYDNTLLEALPFERWEPFCLELFGCRAEPHSIGGVLMSGKRKGDPVHTFPFHQTDAEMGERYLETLHSRLKGKVGRAVYVIAPASACDPGLFQDLLTFDATSYFILRVPYSVIRALHERDFQQVGQPASASEVNDALDAYGFDFVEVPEATVTHTLDGTKLRGRIESFRRGGLDPDEFEELEDEGRPDLAMLMVDYDYDGDVFRVSEHFFAEDLEASAWEFEIEVAAETERVLLVFMDVLGNERREAVELATLRAGPAKKKAPARRRTARAA